MAKRHKPTDRSGAPRAAGDDIFKRRSSTVKSRKRPDGRWELLHPEMVLEMADDLEEVRTMIDEGENEIAVEELRWLLSECRDAIEAHYMLGEVAFEARDFPLARGHFGYAFDLGRSALPPSGVGGKLSYDLPANKPLMQATKGLAFCLYELKKPKTAALVLEELLAWDSADALGARGLLEKWSAENTAE